MSSKANVRKLTSLSACNGHIPPSHQRYQNRAAAVYDMSIDCHDIKTICHVHRLSEATILQDWKGNTEYLQSKMDLSDTKEIKRRFVSIMKEIEEDDLQPTLGKFINEKKTKLMDCSLCFSGGCSSHSFRLY